MTAKKHFAHAKETQPISEWQPLITHLKNTAAKASEFAEAFNSSQWGRIAGLWHDLGKYSGEYQDLIHASDSNSPTPKVDHSTAGAQHAVSRFGSVGKLLAYVIAGHHCGLMDGQSSGACLLKRLEKAIPDTTLCPPELLYGENMPGFPFELDFSNEKRFTFRLWFFTRMIYSCLVDADFIDTEAFMDLEKSSLRGGYPCLDQLMDLLNLKLHQLASDADGSKINHEREKIQLECRMAAAWAPGLFSLTVPTGGGKTLSSLAFAIQHAIIYGKQRIIYVIPYTSIIEQNADVFRNALGDNAVLEHHSNFEPPDDDNQSILAAENWDAPIIVTTNVQFFESLFNNRASKCRKLHNIANSVVIADESHMLPAPYLRPCMEAMRELTEAYDTSIVLCSATQPALNTSETFKDGLDDVREIISEPSKLYETFKRVKVENLGRIEDSDLIQRITAHDQVLCIVNTRKHARELFQELKQNPSGTCCHLSAAMCAAHRTEVLTAIRLALMNNEPCRVISTQLIEAGVDIDFPVVFREIAGIDSIAQASGRCNREGHIKAGGRVYIFEPERCLPPGHFRETAQTAKKVLKQFTDALSLEAVQAYFTEYYWRKGDALDEFEILDDIAEGASAGDFPFKRVSGKFKIIDTEEHTVIIPWNSKSEEIIHMLAVSDTPRMWARRAQRYTAQLRPSIFHKLLSQGSIEQIQERFNILTDLTYYSNDLGLVETP